MIRKANKKNTDQITVRESFQSIVLRDVLRSIERFEKNNSQNCKRDLIRTMFAGLEGNLWALKEFVKSTSEDLGLLPSLVNMALSEKDYSVSEQGEVKEKIRFISMPITIKLIAKLMRGISSELVIDFGSDGWSNLNKAIKIRNRITHPKHITDLEISDEDIATSMSGFFWFLSLSEQVMVAGNAASSAYLDELRVITELLKNEDAEIMKYYRASLLNNDD